MTTSRVGPQQADWPQRPRTVDRQWSGLVVSGQRLWDRRVLSRALSWVPVWGALFLHPTHRQKPQRMLAPEFQPHSRPLGPPPHLETSPFRRAPRHLILQKTGTSFYPEMTVWGQGNKASGGLTDGATHPSQEPRGEDGPAHTEEGVRRVQ